MPFFGSDWNDDFDDDSPIGISSSMKEYIGDDYYCTENNTMSNDRMSKVCSHCGSTEVVVHNDVGMATCRECGYAGSVLSFDAMNIAFWLAQDTHALAELFVVRQFNSLYCIVEGVEPISWYSILIPDKTFKSRQEAVSESVNALKREASYQDFYKFIEQMRKYNAPAEGGG